MLMKSTEFFKNLPPKKCVDCGTEIKEMHESYLHQCDHCLSKASE